MELRAPRLTQACMEPGYMIEEAWQIVGGNWVIIFFLSETDRIVSVNFVLSCFLRLIYLFLERKRENAGGGRRSKGRWRESISSRHPADHRAQSRGLISGP